MNKEAETLLAILTTSTFTEAASKLGITLEGLSKRRIKYGIDKQIAALPEQALDRLRIGSVKAANELVNQLDDRQIQFRNKAANDVLGYVVPRQNTGGVAVQVNFNKVLADERQKFDL